ncbi:MAG: T9SS type A sorting domain-containing protein [Bacteroidia bacterium]
MKKSTLFSFLLVLLTATSAYAQTRTSIANGNWNNPAIWSPTGIPQVTDNVIIINSQVTFAQNITFGNAEFRINSGASLVSTGLDTITLGCDLALFNGFLQTDVLIVGTGDSAVNSGTIVAGQLLQSGTFINNASGQICLSTGFITNDFLVNNGSVAMDSWANGAQVTGSGKYCIAGIFINSASITGNGDICDATPGGLGDFNVGTIASSITNCQVGPCATCGPPPNAVAEVVLPNNSVTASPNPMNEQTVITITGVIEPGTQLELLSVQGKLIRAVNVTANIVAFEREGLEAGVYLYRIVSNNVPSAAGKLIVQ